MKPEPGDDALDLRRRAEGRLQSSQRDVQAQPDESLRLLHELQVHQIELEMQNESLHRANEEAERLRDKYRDLYDFAPVGYFTLADDGSILESNLAGAALLGCGRSEAVGHRLRDFMQAESRPLFEDFLAAAWRGSSEESVMLVLQPPGGNPLCVKVQGRCSDPDRETMLSLRLAMMDVTAVKFANDELQRSFEKFFTYFRP